MKQSALRAAFVAVAGLASGLASGLPSGLVLAVLGGPVAAQDAIVDVDVRRDVPFVPTPEPIVDKMLDMARVGKDDVVYDLGSGDGRIVIAAARRGARGVGVDIDPARIDEGVANAEAAGVQDRVQFVRGDLFDANLRPATVVTLYLLPNVNLRLRPKLLDELRPGTRVVSHSFDMGDWEPDDTALVGGSRVYVWTVPAKPERASQRRN